MGRVEGAQACFSSSRSVWYVECVRSDSDPVQRAKHWAKHWLEEDVSINLCSVCWSYKARVRRTKLVSRLKDGETGAKQLNTQLKCVRVYSITRQGRQTHAAINSNCPGFTLQKPYGGFWSVAIHTVFIGYNKPDTIHRTPLLLTKDLWRIMNLCQWPRTRDDTYDGALTPEKPLWNQLPYSNVFPIH